MEFHISSATTNVILPGTQQEAANTTPSSASWGPGLSGFYRLQQDNQAAGRGSFYCFCRLVGMEMSCTSAAEHVCFSREYVDKNVSRLKSKKVKQINIIQFFTTCDIISGLVIFIQEILKPSCGILIVLVLICSWENNYFTPISDEMFAAHVDWRNVNTCTFRKAYITGINKQWVNGGNLRTDRTDR